MPHQHVAANVPGFPTARFDEIAAQQTPVFGAANHQVPGVPYNYRTPPPRTRTYTGVPLPRFGCDPINVDEEIEFGTSFAATHISEVEAENAITARTDEPQESGEEANSVKGINKRSSPKMKMFSFFPEKK